MTDKQSLAPGLTEAPIKDWKGISAREEEKKPIERLKPNTELHLEVLNYLKDRIKMSQDKMSEFYDRWRVNEAKFQAYINLPDWEQELKNLNDAKEPPKVVSITVPYMFATISTIVTYMMHTFGGRKPIFQVSANKSETVESASNMETILQYQMDHTRFLKKLTQGLLDANIYGVAAWRVNWVTEKAMRTVWQTNGNVGFGGVDMGAEKVKVRKERVVFEGNQIDSIDPFMFLPDPRCPMHEVNRKGEFVFWKSYEGRHTLKKSQEQGKLNWVDYVSGIKTDRDSSGTTSDDSARNLLSQGESVPGRENDVQGLKMRNTILVHQGTVDIIPKELGLGNSTKVEKWIFSIANQKQIIQAEPFDADHGLHPVAVTEPYGMGYGFGQPGISDYVAPMQDTLSWLVNSHMDNVRTALNNMFLVDPSKVELQDLKKPGAGKLIRLKKSAYGQDIRQAISQLEVKDVTSNHVRDFQMMMGLTDSLSSVSDNLRGIQDSGGRKTATEIRTSGEASASRLAATSRVISAQALVDIAEMCSLNTQQYMTQEFYAQVVGSEGEKAPVQIEPEMVTGDFHYPIHDGTLPIDKIAMLDVWKEILLGVMQDQELRGSFSVPKIFEYIAELGGAKNIEQFKLQIASPEAIQSGVASGQLNPLQGNTGPGPSGLINANPIDPSQRGAGII